MKYLLYSLLGIFFFLFGCKKIESDNTVPVNTVFIRVQNISSIDYLNIRIDPNNLGQSEDMGALMVGTISEYKGFKSVSKEFSTTVKVSANLEKGILFSASTDKLSPGKYTLKIDYRVASYNPNINDIYTTLNED